MYHGPGKSITVTSLYILFGTEAVIVRITLSPYNSFQLTNLKMSRKRDRITGWFNRSRNISPAPTAQQASSSNVGQMPSTVLLPSAQPQLCQVSSSIPPLSPLTPSTESSVKEVASVAWEGVKTALILLKESSDWFPPLKSAIGGFLALIDAIEVSETTFLSSNHLT